MIQTARVVVCDIVEDGRKCDARVGGVVSIADSDEALRTYARLRGWTSRDVEGTTHDLCPKHG